MMGPCAKTVVRCTIITPDGQWAIGTNACANPQPVCPRLPGEGYEKCKTVCDQRGHAEVQALRVAAEDGIPVKGAHAYFEGHTYACQPCQEALYGAGVAAISRGAPPS